MISYRKKDKKVGNYMPERVSSLVYYVLLAVGTVVICLFYLIGYDTPFWADPQFNEPQLTDVLLIYILLLAEGVLVAVTIAFVMGLRISDRVVYDSNRLPVRRISVLTSLLPVVCMVVSFIAGSSWPVPVNGKPYTEMWWLKATDMFIWTIAVLIFVALALVVESRIRHGRYGKYKGTL